MTDLNLPMEVIPPEPPQPLISDEAESQALYPVGIRESIRGGGFRYFECCARS